MRVLEVQTTAPAKAILFGEHAVNRGQMALAVSVGLRARCRLQIRDQGPYRFRGAAREREVSREQILALGQQVDAWRAEQRYDAIRDLAVADFFTSHQYILASAFGERLPPGMDLAFESEIPLSSGLGSGGACFAALARALAALQGTDDLKTVGHWAHLGDVVAHGGVASGLDTQTSLHGGVVKYTQEAWGEPIAYHPSLALVVGDTGVIAQTSEINTRVREWLAADATRLHHFQSIGLLSNLALEALRAGDWPLLGRLMSLNQLVLEKIGVSCPELERLNRAALAAGALGAKLAGSGGGGIMIALATPETRQAVAAALARAGGRLLTPEVGVPGACVEYVQTEG